MTLLARANPEPCLLATRGQPRRLAGDVAKLLIAPRREHSRKPDETYPRIERLLPGPYLELFARQSRPGWDGVGDQDEASLARILSRIGRGRADPFASAVSARASHRMIF